MAYTCTIAELDNIINSLAVNTASTPYEVILTDVTGNDCIGYYQTETRSALEAALTGLTRYISLTFNYVQYLNIYTVYFSEVSYVVKLTLDNLTANWNYASLINQIDSMILKLPNLSYLDIGSHCQDTTSIDGVLYSTESKITLFRCPIGKTGTLSLPADLYYLSDVALYSCLKITTVIINNNQNILDTGMIGFSTCTALKNITLPYNNISIIDSLISNDISSPYNITIIDITDIDASANDRTQTVWNKVTRYSNLYLSSPSLTKLSPSGSSITSFPYITGLSLQGSSCTTIANSQSIMSSYLPNLKLLDLGSQSLDYKSEDNLIYTSDYKTLYYCTPKNDLNVVIRDTVETINEAVFQNRTAVKGITLPLNLKTVGNSAFSAISANYKVTWKGIIDDWVNIDFASPTANPMNVRYSTFYYGDSLLKDVVLTSAPKIKKYAFYNNRILENIVISSNVTEIQELAFYNCRLISKITIPDSVSFIGAEAFLYCFGLTKLTLNTISLSIDSRAFASTDYLNSVNFNGTINEWCSINFYNEAANPLHNSVAKLYVSGEHVTSAECNSMNDYCFYNYKSLKNLICNGTIAEHSLTGCTGIQTITLNGNLTNLSGRFKNLTSLDTVYNMPSSVTNLTQAFSGCTSLKDIYNWSVDPSVTTMTNCFTDCTALENIYVSMPKVSDSSSSWHLITLDLAAAGCTLTVYSNTLDAVTGELVTQRTKSVTYSGDKKLRLFNLIDELAGAGVITAAELKNLMTYRYQFGTSTDGLDPSKKSFVIWASDENEVHSNIGNGILSLTDADFDQIF